MTKEEILEKSRNENKNKDLADLEVQAAALRIAFYSSFGFCILTSVLSMVFTGKVNLTGWMIFTGMVSTVFLVKFIMAKKKHELFVFICYAVLFALCTSGNIFQLMGKC